MKNVEAATVSVAHDSIANRLQIKPVSSSYLVCCPGNIWYGKYRWLGKNNCFPYINKTFLIWIRFQLKGGSKKSSLPKNFQFAEQRERECPCSVLERVILENMWPFLQTQEILTSLSTSFVCILVDNRISGSLTGQRAMNGSMTGS